MLGSLFRWMGRRYWRKAGHNKRPPDCQLEPGNQPFPRRKRRKFALLSGWQEDQREDGALKRLVFAIDFRRRRAAAASLAAVEVGVATSSAGTDIARRLDEGA